MFGFCHFLFVTYVLIRDFEVLVVLHHTGVPLWAGLYGENIAPSSVDGKKNKMDSSF